MKQTFAIRQDNPTVASRQASRKLREEMETLLAANPDLEIQIDLSDLHITSSSFADEVVAKLFHSLGPVQFTNRIQIRGSNPDLTSLIERSIQKRYQTQDPQSEARSR